MSLSNDLISQFVKVTKDDSDNAKKDSTVFGTIVEYNGAEYVRLDGSDILTPITTTAGVKDGDRVTIEIVRHSAIVTGNVSSPSAGKGDIDEIGGKVDDALDEIADFEIVITGKIDAVEGNIDNLVSDNVIIKEKLTAVEADIGNLEADNVTINNKLTANEAEIENLKTTKLDAEIADIKYATIKNLEATNANIYNLEVVHGKFEDLTTGKFEATEAKINELETNKLSAEEANLKYANIDFANIGDAAIENFFAKSGMIEDIVIDEGKVTGTLVGVTIIGDYIKGGTIQADKLVIKGTDGLYYKLNTNGETVEGEQTNENSINGSIITAKSITATKIAVSDLVAFDATIGGFKITDSSLYSGVKSSIDNTTRGIYLDKDGQIVFGDADNFIKFYRVSDEVYKLNMTVGDENNYLKLYEDTDGSYKVDISADSISFGSGKDLSETIEEIENTTSNLEIGGRNLQRNTTFKGDLNFWLVDSSYSIDTELLFENSNTVKFQRAVDAMDNPSAYFHTNPEMNFISAEEGQMFTASAYFYTTDAASINGPVYLGVWFNNSEGTSFAIEEIEIPFENGKWIKCIVTGTAPANTASVEFGVKTTEDGTFNIAKPKLERGNKATDWTPAPEDLDLSDALERTEENLEDLGNKVNEDLSEVRLSIDGFNNTISSLVVDGNGSSMMEQTEDGWRFDMSEYINGINDAKDKAYQAEKDVATISDNMTILQNDMSNVIKKTAYINLTTDETGSPCIELGRSDSEFKVRLTNTSLDFLDGTSKIAYVSNETFYIYQGIIKNNLQIGETNGFTFKTRSNGNMGLRKEI